MNCKMTGNLPRVTALGEGARGTTHASISMSAVAGNDGLTKERGGPSCHSNMHKWDTRIEATSPPLLDSNPNGTQEKKIKKETQLVV